MQDYAGLLEYQCRRCGEIKKSTHAPNCLITLILLSNEEELPREWGGLPVRSTNTCHCKDGHIGISDLIGATLDKPRKE